MLVDKPAGPTSHDVVAMVRRMVGHKGRAGHTGTLDPFATGLLVILVGRATRLSQFLVGLPKCYEGSILLGQITTTDDPTGEPVSTSDRWRELDDAMIAAAMSALTGRIAQRPPVHSAKKVRGRPAHRRVRRGESVTLAEQWVEVQRFAPVGRAGPEIRFTAEVGSGTYIRSLARDLGDRLGCGAHLASLRRTQVGPFTVAEATDLAAIRAGTAEIQPARAVLAHLPQLELESPLSDRLRAGQTVEPPDRIGEGATGPIAVLVDGELLAVAERDHGNLRPRVVLQG